MRGGSNFAVKGGRFERLGQATEDFDFFSGLRRIPQLRRMIFGKSLLVFCSLGHYWGSINNTLPYHNIIHTTIFCLVWILPASE